VLTDALMDLEAEVLGPRIELTAEDQAEVGAAHREILDAIAAREGERARAAMQGHIVDMRRLHRGVRDAAS